jgi:hypothetical protein
VTCSAALTGHLDSPEDRIRLLNSIVPSILGLKCTFVADVELSRPGGDEPSQEQLTTSLLSGRGLAPMHVANTSTVANV